ncbi:MAG: tetratricopeptide repeat protein [Candidatus Gracilibacteria bacterium]|nr:tetratricopeptide repeat protein [Candidatus Gracilibacteria bacterium]
MLRLNGLFTTNAKIGKTFFIRSNFFYCLILILLTFGVYAQVFHFDFVHYDDHVYVTDNYHVKIGLTVENIRWALTSLDAGFWHPLTWLSLMFDHDLYGLNAGGYHLTNVLFHIINTLLLFNVLGRMTGTWGRSFFVAALFALHPLHVESVAWIAARKDVLSTFFMLLTLWGYIGYGQKHNVFRYFGVVFFFILGLMAKSMLVTLPFILLLLDWWPLQRFRIETPINNVKQFLCSKNTGWLFLEKIPLLVLAVGVSVATIIAEEKVGALTPMISFPVDARLSNSLVSYVLYIGKMFCPVNLAVFYPHPGAWLAGAVVLSVLFLGGISYFSIHLLKKYPYFAVGWFWYLGTLVPVIGLVQVGMHAMADRYTYIPLIGLFIVITWGSVDLCKRLSCSKLLLLVLAFVIITAFSIQTYIQTSYWQNPVVLFRHALQVTKDNYIAYNNLGASLARRGMPDAAINQYKEALCIMPRYLEANFNLGAALADLGNYKEAIDYYRRALAINPIFPEAHNNLAVALAAQGNLEEAVRHFRLALNIRPDYEGAQNNLRIAEQERQQKIKEQGTIVVLYLLLSQENRIFNFFLLRLSYTG